MRDAGGGVVRGVRERGEGRGRLGGERCEGEG